MDQPFMNYMNTPPGILQVSADDHQVLGIHFVQEKHRSKRSNAITQGGILSVMAGSYGEKNGCWIMKKGVGSEEKGIDFSSICY